jgi:hypothetical protein
MVEDMVEDIVEKMNSTSTLVKAVDRIHNKAVIEERLRYYLSRDRTGIRREILRLFVKNRSLTIAELVTDLRSQFAVTFQAIASMVGIIASRIGILRAIRNSDHVHNYELREKYFGIVVRIVGIN